MSPISTRRDPHSKILTISSGFHIEWLSWKAIEFDDVSHLTHKEEHGVPITRGRFVLELCASTGFQMMQRFGVPELVPEQRRQPSNMSTVGSLALSRLGLAPTLNRDAIYASGSTSDSGDEGELFVPEIRHPSTSTAKRPLEMEIDDSEDDKRQRIEST